MNRDNLLFLLILPLLLLLTLSACSDNTPIPTPTPPSPTPQESSSTEGGAAQIRAERTILAFGDSVTEGLGVEEEEAYPAKLEARLQADGYPYAVMNGGISGETSSAALTRLDWMLQNKPDIVIVETGGNDALRGVDLDLTKNNISEIVQRLKAEDITVVLAGMQVLQNLGEEYTTTFANIYPAIAEEENVILIPFFLEGVGGVPELNQPDVIHPTAEGYTVVVENLYPYVLEAIEVDQARGK